MEKRKDPDNIPQKLSKGTEIPPDYLKMVTEVVNTNFEDALEALSKVCESIELKVSGRIYHDEVIVVLSLVFGKQLTAISISASSDFDPKASAPKADELLGVCVDALGAVFQSLVGDLSKKRLELIAAQDLSGIKDIPQVWTEAEINKRKVFVIVDKANPNLEQMADEWLDENDPEVKEELDTDESKTKSKFVTGENAQPKNEEE